MPKCIKAVKEGLKVKPGTVIVSFSAVTKQGREEIWQIMDEAVGYEE